MIHQSNLCRVIITPVPVPTVTSLFSKEFADRLMKGWGNYCKMSGFTPKQIAEQKLKAFSIGAMGKATKMSRSVVTSKLSRLAGEMRPGYGNSTSVDAWSVVANFVSCCSSMPCLVSVKVCRRLDISILRFVCKAICRLLFYINVISNESVAEPKLFNFSSESPLFPYFG